MIPWSESAAAAAAEASAQVDRIKCIYAAIAFLISAPPQFDQPASSSRLPLDLISRAHEQVEVCWSERDQVNVLWTVVVVVILHYNDLSVDVDQKGRCRRHPFLANDDIHALVSGAFDDDDDDSQDRCFHKREMGPRRRRRK